jgi:general secretion pathway protein G
MALIEELTDHLGACCWKGPYLNDVVAIPHDSWGRAYHYQSPGPHGEPYWIISYGEDGRPGGTGEAEDVTCHRCGRQDERGSQ